MWCVVVSFLEFEVAAAFCILGHANEEAVQITTGRRLTVRRRYIYRTGTKNIDSHVAWIRLGSGFLVLIVEVTLPVQLPSKSLRRMQMFILEGAARWPQTNKAWRQKKLAASQITKLNIARILFRLAVQGLLWTVQLELESCQALFMKSFVVA